MEGCLWPLCQTSGMVQTGRFPECRDENNRAICQKGLLAICSGICDEVSTCSKTELDERTDVHMTFL